MPIEPGSLSLGMVAGGAIGAIISHLLTKSRDKENRAAKIFADASNEFLDVFHDELSGLYPNPINWPDDIDGFLRAKFTILNAAVSKFRRFLPSEKWDTFDNAWHAFYNATGREIDNKNCQCYHHYMPFSGSSIENGKAVFSDTSGSYKDTFKHNVDNLLSFAKIK